MSAVPLIGFVLIALLAIAFAVVPLLRMKAGSKKSRALLLAAIALFMLGIGGGSYYILGRPHLAQRDAEGLNTREVNGLIPFLVKRVHEHPEDARAWRYLGQAYMTANDPRDAARALAKVIALTGKGDAALDAAYGEAVMLASGGAVPPAAEEAFTAALAADPKNAPARFYLGLAKLAHGDRPGTIALWQSLLADTPVTAPLHQILVDRIAMLTSQGAGGAPNPRAMVDMLAARLKADPNDALGWVRLMRAYTVLGEKQKALQALSSARKAFAGNADAQTAFTTAAKALKLQ
ncbi:MAG TPA: tetratricopeptide repeat protein [Rhizomicrobium sp.]|nr:tetratricopeptide repeat protein [Rhizomicrobium sp.]